MMSRKSVEHKKEAHRRSDKESGAVHRNTSAKPTKSKSGERRIDSYDPIEVARLVFQRGENGKLKRSVREVKELLHLQNSRRIVPYAERMLSAMKGGPRLALSLRDTQPTTTEKLQESHEQLRKDFPLVYDRGLGVVVDEVASEELTRRFSCLWKATVVKMPPDVLTERDPSRKSNRIHQILAQAMAAHIIDFARDGDHAAFGSGRGVLDTCQQVKLLMNERALRTKGSPQWRRMRLTSLTGWLGADRWLEVGQSLDEGVEAANRADADNAVLSFAGACVGPSTSLVNFAIAMPEGEDREEFIRARAPHLDLISWQHEVTGPSPSHQYVPHWCLVGVGAVAAGHCLMRATNRMIESVKNEVEELRDIIEHYKGDDSPVIDLCNELHVVERDGNPIANKAGDKLEDLTQRLNNRLVCATDQHLKLSDLVFVVAGGIEKGGALRFVLQKALPGRKVVLVTDLECTQRTLS